MSPEIDIKIVSVNEKKKKDKHFLQSKATLQVLYVSVSDEFIKRSLMMKIYRLRILSSLHTVVVATRCRLIKQKQG